MKLTFGDADQQGRRKRTRRDIFLSEMEQVVPWKALLASIEPQPPKTGGPGRQPYRLESMLRIRLLQRWHAVSDPAMEEALCDTPVMHQFTQFGGVEEIPDETSILNFQRLLDKHQLAAESLK